jgi:hypothetical protein
MDKSIDIVLRNGIRNSLGAFDMHILQIKVPKAINT